VQPFLGGAAVTQDVHPNRLNERYGLPGHLGFEPGPGGLPVATIENADAAASVCLAGGHVLSFRPHGAEPVLWLSRHSRFESGRPIRGGIPVCWPWFAAHPEDPAKPFHGFARLAHWSVLGTEALDGGNTRLRLGLTDDEATRRLWPHAFELEMAVTVGRDLHVALTARNPGPEPFTCTGALHTYFRVGEVARIAVHGLNGCRYREAGTDGGVQQGPVTFDREVDRLYLDTDAACTIEDPVLARRIRVAKAGSRSTVVWNPWIDKARRMPDFGDDEYTGMVCVETANAGTDAVTIPPGGAHCLEARIAVEPAPHGPS